MKSSNEQNINKTGGDIIGGFGYYSLLYFLLKANFLGMGFYIIIQKTNQNCYISSIIGVLLGIILISIFLVIANNKKKLDITQLNLHIFGKYFGGVINTIVFCGVAFLAIVLTYNFILFINSHYIQEVSSLFTLVLIMVPILYLANQKISVISRVGQCIFILNLVLFTMQISGLYPQIEVYNLFPIMDGADIFEIGKGRITLYDF